MNYTFENTRNKKRYLIKANCYKQAVTFLYEYFPNLNNCKIRCIKELA